MKNLTFTYGNGIFKVSCDGEAMGQARNIETLIENSASEAFPPEMRFHAAEVLRSLFGELPPAGNEQISG